MKLLAALADLLGQGAFQDAEPVAVGDHLVFGVDHGDRVLQVEDRRQRGFEHHVGHAGCIAGADRRAAVDADFQMQAVVAQQHRRRRRRVALPADQRGAASERRRRAALQRDHQPAAFDAVAGGVRMRAAFERRRLIEEAARIGDHLGAALRVVARPGRPGLRNRVGAVERVVERAPARIGSVERVARVEHRHHQLRAGLARQLVVDVGGRRLHIGRRRHQVADRLEKAAVGRHVGDRTRVAGMPLVEL